MTLKHVFYYALILGGVAFSPVSAGAQPGVGVPDTSLEARILQSRIVFRGRITNVFDAVIHTNNQSSPEGIFSNKPLGSWDIHNYTFTLTVDEVLKGDLPRRPLKLTVNYVSRWPELEKSAEEHASYLWFAKDSEKTIGADFFAGLDPPNNIYLGATLPERKNDFRSSDHPRVYDMEMKVLTNREQILSHARAFAKKHVNTGRFHSIRLPELGDRYFFQYKLVVPVVPALENIARHLIAKPDDFIVTKGESDLAPQWRCDYRAEGVSALQYFKSAENIKLLKSLLDASDYWIAGPDYKIYSVRQVSYEVLRGWGVDVPKPVTQETVPADNGKK